MTFELRTGRFVPDDKPAEEIVTFHVAFNDGDSKYFFASGVEWDEDDDTWGFWRGEEGDEAVLVGFVTSGGVKYIEVLENNNG